MSSHDVIIDLETIRRPELPGDMSPERGERTPAPPHNQIVAAGKLLLVPSATGPKLGGLRVYLDEIAGTRSLVRTLNDPRSRAVTWGGRRFDLPVLGAACLRHGIAFPRYFSGEKGQDFRYRFGDFPHLDLMDRFSDHGSATLSTLDATARLIGLPGKGDVDGGKVATLHADGKIEEIAAYNAEDLLTTAVVYLRWKFVSGALGATLYTQAVTGLLDDAVKERESLRSYVERIDRQRLLTVGEA